MVYMVKEQILRNKLEGGEFFMKRRLIYLTVVFSIFTLLLANLPVYAITNGKSYEITPFYKYTNKTVTNLSISQSGNATCTASLYTVLYPNSPYSPPKLTGTKGPEEVTSPYFYG